MKKNLNAHVEWKEDNNQKYLAINFQFCSNEERLAISKIAVMLIAEEDFNSVRLLIDIRNTKVSVESMRVVKKEWMNVRLKLLKISLVGVTGVKSMLLKLWVNMTNLKVQPSNTTDEAIVYLCR